MMKDRKQKMQQMIKVAATAFAVGLCFTVLTATAHAYELPAGGFVFDQEGGATFVPAGETVAAPAEEIADETVAAPTEDAAVDDAAEQDEQEMYIAAEPSGEPAQDVLQEPGDEPEDGLDGESEAEEAPAGEVRESLDEIMQAPASVYNHSLAVISAELSNKAYSQDGSEVAEYLEEYGFDKKNISSYNYGGSYAYTLAVKDYRGQDSDNNTKILVMAARGSVTTEEFSGDTLSEPTVDYNGYKVYTVVDTFFQEIMKHIGEFMKSGYNYKILSTGHSLGGAVANLFAAVQTMSGNSNVYCYTFGAIDSIQSPTKGQSVTEGFENIHNIYNDYDTFSPTQYGWLLFGGAGSKYGKFGHMDSYSIDHRTEKQKDDDIVTQVSDHINHSMDNYLADTKNKPYTCPEEYGGSDEDDPKDPTPDPDSGSGLYPQEGNVSDSSQAAPTTEMIDILYSAGEVDLGTDAVTLNRLVTVKDSENRIITMIELVNKSGREITVHFDSIVADGKTVDAGHWNSALVAPGDHLLIALTLSEIAPGARNASVALHICDENGREFAVTNPITLLASPDRSPMIVVLADGIRPGLY